VTAPDQEIEFLILGIQLGGCRGSHHQAEEKTSHLLPLQVEERLGLAPL
jgi:hypothetical protein